MFATEDDERGSPPLPFGCFWLRLKKEKKKISKKILKPPTNLVVISYRLKQAKISYANGSVSVRIFYKNNLINPNSFLSTHATHATHFLLSVVAPVYMTQSRLVGRVVYHDDVAFVVADERGLWK